ncbi:MAG: DUF1018 domain-containing protein [Bradyrhizobium sp.]|nr:DUF1018 domain-containing protein [Bradyrhizobium sp.]
MGSGARNRELARIHILAAELKLDRPTYEAVLWTLARVDSAGKLDEGGRRQVIAHLERLRGGRARVEGTPPRTLHERPLLKKIAAQLGDAERPWGYAAALAERLCGKERLEFCGDAELGKIVAALAIDQSRRRKRGAPAK